MEPKGKILFFVSLLFLSMGLLLLWESRSLGKARLVFCDVGQGDGMILVSATGKQVLVDSGPGTKILECLDQQMPFWDRSIDMLIVTHAQKDHTEGFLPVLERYKVDAVLTTGVGTESSLYREWEKLVSFEKANKYRAVSGDKIVVDESLWLDVLWPTRAAVEGWQRNPPSDLNETSFVMRLNLGEECVYLTGDIPKETLARVIDRQCDFLKVAHHGSKTGTNDAVLEKAKPKFAVIQVGKNSYGHPTEEVLGILEKFKVRVLRNDLLGTIELDFDGSGYHIK